MEADFSTLNQKVQRLNAEVALLKAQQIHGSKRPSLWLPLKEAASLLNFRSARALRQRIQSSKFPPDCFRVDPTSAGTTNKYLVNAERYIKQLR
jgi:hypothetical protein